MVVDPGFGAAEAAEIFLSSVCAGAVKALSLLMVDTLHFEALMQAIKRTGFVGVDYRALDDASADE
jgi:hypothetical protein